MAIVKIQMRRGTAAEWSSSNPILSSGEVGVELPSKRAKMGDGSTPWSSLDWWVGEGTIIGESISLDPTSPQVAFLIDGAGTGNAYSIYKVDTRPLQDQSSERALLYMRPGDGTNIIAPLIRVDDAPNGAPILQLFNEGGLWVNDRIQFTHYTGGNYVRGVAMTWLDETNNDGPALIFGQDANPVADPWDVTADADTVTVGANKGTWIRRLDGGNLGFSKTLLPDPTRHNAIDLGVSTSRWRDVFIQGVMDFAGKTLGFIASAVNGGNPNGQHTAPAGSARLSETGRFYIKDNGSGNTGWVEVPTKAVPVMSLPIANSGQGLSTTLTDVTGAQLAYDATDYPAPHGMKLQHRICGSFGGLTAGDIVGVLLRDSASVTLIAEATATTPTPAGPTTVRSAWNDVSTTEIQRVVVQVRNQTAARGNARMTWLELRWVPV